MASSSDPPSGGFILVTRMIAATITLVSVFAFVWILIDHGFDLKSALLGVSGCGVVAGGIAHRLLGIPPVITEPEQAPDALPPVARPQENSDK